MRIAQVAPPFESVPPAKYGGTERVVSLLTEELVRRGHDVTLFASGDSTTRARHVPTVDTALWRLDHVRDPLVYWTITLGETYRRAAAGEFDIVHAHLDFLSFPFAQLVPTPTITTLHGRLDLPDLPRLYARFPGAAVVSISNDQRRPLPEASWAATVYNGVDTEILRFVPAGGDYLAWIGRISPEKGLDRAIRIAQLAGLPLKVAARLPLLDKNDPNVRTDWEYYDGIVKPLLETADVELIGEVGDHEKTAFLGGARALINPIDWPEPFGLVMAEALACGTPVVARRRGSVPEIVSHGVTGLIGETDQELADYCRRAGSIDRAACRAEAVRRFSVAAMTDGYEAVYDARLDAAVLPSVPAAMDLIALPATSDLANGRSGRSLARARPGSAGTMPASARRLRAADAGGG